MRTYSKVLQIFTLIGIFAAALFSFISLLIFAEELLKKGADS
ncbi:hypothetical protein [Anaerosphaera multitolerans]|nr:hypothetical protein [Anaerosphaera multitolerans]